MHYIVDTPTDQCPKCDSDEVKVTVYDRPNRKGSFKVYCRVCTRHETERKLGKCYDPLQDKQLQVQLAIDAALGRR